MNFSKPGSRAGVLGKQSQARAQSWSIYLILDSPAILERSGWCISTCMRTSLSAESFRRSRHPRRTLRNTLRAPERVGILLSRSRITRASGAPAGQVCSLTISTGTCRASLWGCSVPWGTVNCYRPANAREPLRRRLRSWESCSITLGFIVVILGMFSSFLPENTLYPVALKFSRSRIIFGRLSGYGLSSCLPTSWVRWHLPRWQR